MRVVQVLACRMRWCGLLFSLMAVASLAGCGFEWNYVFGAIGGEINLLASAVPIEDGLDDPNLTEEEREKLRVVIDVRDYAADVIGLNVGSSYRTFANLGGQSLAWNLSASPKDAITPYYWGLPFVGPIPFLGFFSIDDAYKERDRLVAQGYDTLIYEVDAYSTVGLLPDPMTSALFKRPLPSLIDTIFHELAHNTIYTGTNEVFDESLAEFVGRTAAMEYITTRYGPESELAVEARRSNEDSAIFNAFLADLRLQLDAIYARDISREDKIAARGPVFEAARQQMADEVLPRLHDPSRYEAYTTLNFNNAFLLVNVRYNTEPELFEAVYEKTGRNWGAVLDIFRQAEASADPFAFLREQLAR